MEQDIEAVAKLKLGILKVCPKIPKDTLDRALEEMEFVPEDDTKSALVSFIGFYMHFLPWFNCAEAMLYGDDGLPSTIPESVREDISRIIRDCESNSLSDISDDLEGKLQIIGMDKAKELVESWA